MFVLLFVGVVYLGLLFGFLVLFVCFCFYLWLIVLRLYVIFAPFSMLFWWFVCLLCFGVCVSGLGCLGICWCLFKVFCLVGAG